MSSWKRLKSKFSTVAELFQFMWEHKQWWLFPMVIALILLGILCTLAGTSPLAPFMYSIF